jgi:hypothetical protein
LACSIPDTYKKAAENNFFSGLFVSPEEVSYEEKRNLIHPKGKGAKASRVGCYYISGIGPLDAFR